MWEGEDDFNTGGQGATPKQRYENATTLHDFFPKLFSKVGFAVLVSVRKVDLYNTSTVTYFPA